MFFIRINSKQGYHSPPKTSGSAEVANSTFKNLRENNMILVIKMIRMITVIRVRMMIMVNT